MLEKITTVSDLFEQVLKAPSQQVAFERYFLLARTFGPLQVGNLLGQDRYETEWRVNMQTTPYEKTGSHLSLAMDMANDAGITLDQLSDLFEETNPQTPHDILCTVEDAICIIDKFGGA